eukprot:gene2049-2741_t
MPRIKQVNPMHRVSSNVANRRLSVKDVAKNPNADSVSTIKKRRKRSGTAALMEMRRLQKKDTCLIPKAPFRRLVHEIVINNISVGSSLRIQAEALEALQAGAFSYLHHIFVVANAICVRNNRLGLSRDDFVIAFNIVSGRFHEMLDVKDASERLFSMPFISTSLTNSSKKVSKKELVEHDDDRAKASAKKIE